MIKYLAIFIFVVSCGTSSNSNDLNDSDDQNAEKIQERGLLLSDETAYRAICTNLDILVVGYEKVSPMAFSFQRINKDIAFLTFIEKYEYYDGTFRDSDIIPFSNIIDFNSLSSNEKTESIDEQIKDYIPTNYTSKIHVLGYYFIWIGFEIPGGYELVILRDGVEPKKYTCEIK